MRTVGGPLVCGMCGAHGRRIMTLYLGSTYTCHFCQNMGIWDGRHLTALPWWWPPPGSTMLAWIAAVVEVHTASPFGVAPPRPSDASWTHEDFVHLRAGAS